MLCNTRVKTKQVLDLGLKSLLIRYRNNIVTSVIINHRGGPNAEFTREKSIINLLDHTETTSLTIFK